MCAPDDSAPVRDVYGVEITFLLSNFSVVQPFFLLQIDFNMVCNVHYPHFSSSALSNCELRRSSVTRIRKVSFVI